MEPEEFDVPATVELAPADDVDLMLMSQPVVTKFKNGDEEDDDAELQRSNHTKEYSESNSSECLYDVYSSGKGNGHFDSQEEILSIEADLVMNQAERLLKYVVANRRILLENQVNILPAFFRLEEMDNQLRQTRRRSSISSVARRGDPKSNPSKTRATKAEEVLRLVDSINSGSIADQKQDMVHDVENILDDVYMNAFFTAAENVSLLSEDLLDALHHHGRNSSTGTRQPS